MDDVVARLFQGDPRALSRLISLLEQGDPQAAQAMELVHSRTGKAYCVGLTGLPGSGKSTLVDRLTELARARGQSVGIVAVDPTSPFSGGAFLGDRVRMQRHALDPGVFIRSMASRGARGGLPRVIKGVVRLLDASGKDLVMVETVGVGQTELGIMGVADTIVVVLVPEAGDALQAFKAGLAEVADVFVVNKADRPGAQQMVKSLHTMLAMGERKEGGWVPPVVATQAVNGDGVEELYQAVQQHRQWLVESSHLEARRRERRRAEFLETVEEEMSRRLHGALKADPSLALALRRVEEGSEEPYSAALKALAGPLRGWLTVPGEG